MNNSISSAGVSAAPSRELRTLRAVSPACAAAPRRPDRTTLRATMTEVAPKHVAPDITRVCEIFDILLVVSKWFSVAVG
jgi:hypothetical protein